MTLGEHVAPSDEAISLERVGEQVVYEGDRRLARRRYASPDGDVTFDIVLDGPGTAVLALTDDGHVVLTRQFRPGAERVVWDLPGGFVLDEGERVEVRLVSADELRRIARAGDLTAVDAAYLALDHAGLL